MFLLPSIGSTSHLAAVMQKYVPVHCDITVERGHRCNTLEMFNQRGQQNTAFQPGVKGIVQIVFLSGVE